MDSLQWKTEYRQRLFNNKFKYRVAIRQPFAALFKYNNDLGTLKEKINQSYYRKYHNNLSNSFEIYEKLYEWKNKHITQVEFRPSGLNKLLVMTNDVEIVNQLNDILPIENPILLNTNIPINTKYFKRNVIYQYRAYLKYGFLDRKSFDNLMEYIHNHTDEFKVSYNFQKTSRYYNKAASQRTIYNFSQLYISYNNEIYNTILSLRYDDIIGKIYKCEKIPE